MLEQNDEAKRQYDEQGQPKHATQKRHLKKNSGYE